MKSPKLVPIILHAPVTRGGDRRQHAQHFPLGRTWSAIDTDTGLGRLRLLRHLRAPADRPPHRPVRRRFLRAAVDRRRSRARSGHLWEKLHKHSPIHRGRLVPGITHLALGDPDRHSWDPVSSSLLLCRSGNLLGGSATKPVEAYNTDGRLAPSGRSKPSSPIAAARREPEGHPAPAKIKVGSPDLSVRLAPA